MATYQRMILARSPFYVTATGTGIEQAILNVFIWGGDVTSKPAQPTYRLSKSPANATDNEIVFEISQLIRDEFNHNYDPYNNGASGDVVWVETNLVTIDSGGLNPSIDDLYTAVDGYGLFEDGYNPLAAQHRPIQIRNVKNTRFDFSGFITTNTRFAILADPQYVDSFDIIRKSGFDSNVPLTVGTDSTDYVQYFNYLTLGTDDIVEVTLKLGGVVKSRIYFQYSEACQVPDQAVNTLRFVNRDGWVEEFITTGRLVENLNITKDTYRRDLGYNYSVNNHQKQVYNVQTQKGGVINTGWIEKNFVNALGRETDLIEELLMSEYVWLDGTPINITSSSTQLQTFRQDKLINYALEFEYAYNEINNV